MKKTLMEILHQVKTTISGLYRAHPRILFIGSTLVAVMIISPVTWAMIKSSSNPVLPPSLPVAGKQELTTIFPDHISDTASVLLPGIVLSNETANIFPRRQGIVEDIYVDIGDTVKKNQVVALLLPKGVAGQSAAGIAEKAARKAQAEADFLNAKSVSIEAVARVQTALQEEQAQLEVAKRKQESEVQKIRKAITDVAQKYEQAFVTARETRQTAERISLGTNSRTGVRISESDINEKLGILNYQTRYNVSAIINDLYEQEKIVEQLLRMEEDNDEIIRLLELAIDTVLAMHDLLSSTGTNPISNAGKPGKTDPTVWIQQMHTTQAKLYKSKENLEDALFTLQAIEAQEPALSQVARGTLTLDEAMSNDVELQLQQVSLAQQNLSLTQSQQQQMIERSENGVAIANALLRSESATSGNRKILSPFTGIVSKRFIEVGQVVMSSKSAFELVNVPTTLSKEAKAEVQFGLPENMRDAVTVDDIITFFLPGDDNETHEAVVTRISPQVDRKTRTITVQAKIDDSLSLPHHTNVRVELKDDSTPVYRVPSYAVKREDEKNIIWIQSDQNVPMRLTITVHAEDGEMAEISGDMDETTRIILDPPDLFINTALSGDSPDES